MKLPPIIAARVRRLVPLLASTHDGEVIATRNAIVRELASDQRDLHDLAAAIACESDPAPPLMCRAAPAAFGDLARAVRDADGGKLTDRERVFVHQMVALGFSQSPSARQREWLEDIYRRLSSRVAA